MHYQTKPFQASLHCYYYCVVFVVVIVVGGGYGDGVVIASVFADDYPCEGFSDCNFFFAVAAIL